MRTIKFLGIAVALAAVSVTANAQAGPGFGRVMGFDNFARLEARQIERLQMRRFAMQREQRLGQARGLQRGAFRRGPAGIRGGRFAAAAGGRQMRMEIGRAHV